MQATLLINNGKIQVGPKAKVCDISNYDQIKCLGSFYSIVRPMMMTNPQLEKENNPYEQKPQTKNNTENPTSRDYHLIFPE